jgi:hypothetical protein
MSDPNNFLNRWARRKRDVAAEEARSKSPAKDPPVPQGDPADSAARPTQAETPPAFDLSKLPSLDSIGANSDITAFLQPGVPSELKHAALRRAWVADPAIRDFIGPAEYAWDFTNPDAMPGFSGLGPGDDVKKLVAEVFRDATSAPEAKPPALPSAQPTTPPDKIAANLQADEATGVDDKNLVQRDNNIASQEAESEAPSTSTKVRRHGSAMPE